MVFLLFGAASLLSGGMLLEAGISNGLTQLTVMGAMCMFSAATSLGSAVLQKKRVTAPWAEVIAGISVTTTLLVLPAWFLAKSTLL